MKYPTTVVEKINTILNTVDMSNPKGNSVMNFDALHAIRKVLDRSTQWDNIGDNTVLKRKLKKNLVVI